MEDLHTRANEIAPGIAPAAIRRDNRLLASLPRAERRKLIGLCESVQLTFGDMLCEQGERFSHVYFPIDSIISLISSINGRCRVEAGLVGAEGMLGIPLVLGENVAPLQALVLGAGSALRLDAAQFSRQLKRCPALEQTLKRYLSVVINQLAQMVACTQFHLIEARLARWFLMTRDRALSDEFHLTQEVTAYMLGVRRSGITNAANALKKRKLIR